jgi:hypothetical protein
VHRRQRRLLARKLLVKVAGIRRVSDSREVRRRDTFVVDVIKVDVLEEEVALDVFRVGLGGAESASRVSSEELVGELRSDVQNSPEP